MRTTNGKIIACDVDGVLADSINGDYVNAKPFTHAIDIINKCYDNLYFIRLFTARYWDREGGNIHRVYNRGYIELVDWLKKYGVKYDEICMFKPSFDLFIDDRAVRVNSAYGLKDWEENFWPALKNIHCRDKYNQPTELDENKNVIKDLERFL